MAFPHGTNWIRETRISLTADILHQVVPKSMTERLLIKAACASTLTKKIQCMPTRISVKARGQIPFQIGASVLGPQSVNFLAPGGWLTIFYDRRFDAPATPH